VSNDDKTLYRSVNVFRRLEADVVFYRCLQKLPDGGYVVQSADWLRLPLREDQLHQLTAQFVELLFEEPPDNRGPLRPTIEEAIAAFDAQFEQFEER